MNISEYTLNELTDLLVGYGLPKFRASQIYDWIHVHNVSSFDEMTNLPKNLRIQLADLFPLTSSSLEEVLFSEDGTRKYLIGFPDGLSTEAVGIPSNSLSSETDQEDSSGRLTVCFSTQIGCPMGCAFCATGKEGFSRNLTPQEMVDEVSIVQKDFDTRVSNLVAMGQGEPFLNYDALLQALRRFNHDEAFKIGARHITVSTCGLCEGIRKFAHEPEQFTLAVSLHSAIQEKRDILMPALKSESLTSLRSALEYYLEYKGRRISFEYMLLDGINDGEEDLVALIEYCRGLLCHINLIPFNETESAFTASSETLLQYWVNQLEENHISATIRYSKGADIAGACGQLKRQHLS